MGDIPSRTASESTTDLFPSQPILDRKTNSSLSVKALEDIQIPIMTDSPAIELLQNEMTTHNASQDHQDYEARGKSLDQEEQEIRAQLEVILEKKRENRRAKLEEEARQKLIQIQQCLERQRRFRSSIDASVFAALKKLLSVDHDLRVAVLAITDGNLAKVHVDILKYRLIEQLAGTEDEHWSSIARKISDDDTSHRSEAISNNHTVLVPGVAIEKICIQNTPAQDITQENLILSGNTSTGKQASPGDVLGAEIEVEAENVIIAPPVQAGRSQQASDTNDTADLNHDGFEVNAELTSSQEVPDLIDDEPTPVIKCEDDTVDSPPSAKRRKLTEIETSNGSMHSKYNVGMLVQRGNSVSVSIVSNDMPPPSSATNNTTQLSSPTPASRASIADSDVGSKRSRDEADIDSPAATISVNQITKKTVMPGNKRLPPAGRQLVQRVRETHEKGLSVSSEFDCQKCQESPHDPRLSACAHLYCYKCVTKLRKAATRRNTAALCVTCNREIGRKCATVTVEQVQEWRDRYGASDNDDDGPAGDDKTGDSQ